MSQGQRGQREAPRAGVLGSFPVEAAAAGAGPWAGAALHCPEPSARSATCRTRGVWSWGGERSSGRCTGEAWAAKITGRVRTWRKRVIRAKAGWANCGRPERSVSCVYVSVQEQACARSLEARESPEAAVRLYLGMCLGTVSDHVEDPLQLGLTTDLRGDRMASSPPREGQSRAGKTPRTLPNAADGRAQRPDVSPTTSGVRGPPPPTEAGCCRGSGPCRTERPFRRLAAK